MTYTEGYFVSRTSAPVFIHRPLRFGGACVGVASLPPPRQFQADDVVVGPVVQVALQRRRDHVERRETR